MTAKKREPYNKKNRCRILLELQFCLTEEQVCEKWGLTKDQIEGWKREFDYDVWFGGERDAMIAAVYDGPATAESIADYCAYHTHSGHQAFEIMDDLKQLEKEGFLLHLDDGRWAYNRDRLKSPKAYIF